MTALSNEDLGLLLARLLEATRSFTYVAQYHPDTGVLTQLEIAQQDRAQDLLPLIVQTTYGEALLAAVLPQDRLSPQSRCRCQDRNGVIHWLHNETIVMGNQALGVISILPRSEPNQVAVIEPLVVNSRPTRFLRNRTTALSRQELEDALTQDQLNLAYQFQLEPGPQRLVAAEVFLRWRHPQQGLLFPARFLPLAEETGLIRDISLWAAQAAAAQQRLWARLGFVFPLALNLSPRVLEDVSFIESLPAANFLIEFPETALQQYPSLGTGLHALAQRGFVLGLDNAGLSLPHPDVLSGLPLSFVKVARTLVQDLQTPETQQKVRDLLRLAHTCQLTVIADGVETSEQAHWLLREGCTTLQGYLYARPVAAEALEELLRTGSYRLPEPRAIAA